MCSATPTASGRFSEPGRRCWGRSPAGCWRRAGLKAVGRALPLIAAPITAYLNNQHIQSVGDEAIRFYEGFGKAQKKSARRSAG